MQKIFNESYNVKTNHEVTVDFLFSFTHESIELSKHSKFLQYLKDNFKYEIVEGVESLIIEKLKEGETVDQEDIEMHLDLSEMPDDLGINKNNISWDFNVYVDWGVVYRYIYNSDNADHRDDFTYEKEEDFSVEAELTANIDGDASDEDREDVDLNAAFSMTSNDICSELEKGNS